MKLLALRATIVAVLLSIGTLPAQPPQQPAIDTQLAAVRSAVPPTQTRDSLRSLRPALQLLHPRPF